MLVPLVVQLISFDQGDTGRVIFAAHDCGIGVWREGHQNRRLGILGRRNSRGDDVGFLVTSPVVVRRDDGAIFVV
jgi:hypothetical protein